MKKTHAIRSVCADSGLSRMRTKEKARSRPWTKSFPSAGRRQQFNFLMLCGKWPLHGCVVPAQSRGISTRDVLCFGEGRKPSAPAAVQQRAVGRGRNLVCRFLVWMHRHHRGSSSGTQTLESFHGYWQKRVEARARATTISAEALFNSLVSP